MYNLNEVKTVANQSETAKSVFDALSKRERFRSSTNLSKFKRELMEQGRKIVSDEYMETFKRLHDMKIGTLVIGRRGGANRFLWNYNFKNLLKQGRSNNAVEPFKQAQGKRSPTAIDVSTFIKKDAPEALLGANRGTNAGVLEDPKSSRFFTMTVEATPELIALLNKLVGGS